MKKELLLRLETDKKLHFLGAEFAEYKQIKVVHMANFTFEWLQIYTADVKELGLIRTMSKKAKRKTLPMQSYRWLKNGTFQ